VRLVCDSLLNITSGHSVGDEQRTDNNGRELGRGMGVFHQPVRRGAQTLLRASAALFGRAIGKRRRSATRILFVVLRQPMVIGLTGASGFLGQEIIRQAVSQGEQVVAYSRTPDKPISETIRTEAFGPGMTVSNLDAMNHPSEVPVFFVASDWPGKRKQCVRQVLASVW
jgi:hypothetical protein